MSAFGPSRQFAQCSDMSEVEGRPEVAGRLQRRREWPFSDLGFSPPDVCYWGKLRKDVWAASPSVGRALVSGIDPRREPPLAGVSAHSGTVKRYARDPNVRA